MSWLRRPAALAILVAIAGAAVFAPAIAGGWIYDDHLLIPDNPYVHSLHWWPRWFLSDFWDVGEEFGRLGARIAYWRPAITVTYAVDWKLGSGSPAVFHVTNLVWHAGVGALTFILLRRWLGTTWPAALGALLFVIHPTKGESVAWISGRTDVICVAAMLLATEGIARRLRGRPGGLSLELAGTLLAYTSKEQAIVLPVFAAIEAWVQRGRPPLDRPMLARMLRVAAPQIVIAAAYFAIRGAVLPIRAVNLESAPLPLVDHVQTVLETFGRFIALTFSPHELSIQHGLVHVADGAPVHSTIYVVLGGVSVAALISVAIMLRRRHPAVALGIGFYLVTMMPTANIINTQMKTLVSERFLYLPLLGVTFAFGAILAHLNRRASYAGAGVVIAVLAALALARAADYSDEDAFWARELALHPDSSEARRGRIRAEIKEKRYRAALLDSLMLTNTAPPNEHLPAAADIAQLAADLTPDRDRESLESIDQFCHDLIARTPPEAVLQVQNFTFRIATTTKSYAMYLGAYQLKLLALRAAIRSRLGDDAAALQLAKDGLDKCPRCPSTITVGALTFARAGAYDEARLILDSARGRVPDGPLDAMSELVENSRKEHARAQTTQGPAQLQARAAALAALELWGRAYAVLAPYKDQIKRAPKFAPGFAELAVRAGEPAVAREVLAGSLDPVALERQIAKWSATMGWAD